MTLLPAERVRAACAAVVFALGALVLYVPVALKLVRQWWMDPDYSHGFIIAPLVFWLAWSRRHEIMRGPQAPRASGVVVCVGALLLLTLGTLGAELFLTRVSLLLFIAGAVIFSLGWRQLAPLAFPFGLLLLTIPVPAIVVSRITLALQLFASTTAEGLLRLSGIPVFREGNVLVLSNAKLQVAEACSGIRSLMALLTLGLVVAWARQDRWTGRVAIIASAVPIAVLVNAWRVAASAFSAHWYGQTALEGRAHDVLGWMMFLIAFGLLAAVARTLAVVLPPRDRALARRDRVVA
jgi:exosortase